MQILLFLEYHQNSDICRDIVFRKSLGAGVRGATGRMSAAASVRTRTQVTPAMGIEGRGAEGSKHHMELVEPIFSEWAAGKAIYFAAEALQPCRR
jgi:hypothetical protein